MSHDPPSKDRRHFLTTSSVLGAAGVLWSALPFANAASLSPASNPGGSMTADLILHNGRFHTVDRDNPTATAVAIKDGKFLAVGNDAEAMLHRGSATQVIDLQKRTVIPGLNDSHLHLIRGGLNYNLELRWEGVPSLADALRMLKNQAERTPSPQWVRVVGGWNEFQFAEKRMPTLEELNKAAPDTPVFVLHLYDRALLNRAALRVVGYTKDTPNPPGGEIVRDSSGEPTGMLIARPNAMILYATLAKTGQFREDLYYRLHVISLKLPALRERGNDVMEIARAFLARQCTRMGRAPLSFAHDAEQAIRHYPWPGNVRELENAIERAVILSESQEIHADLLGIDIELDDLEDDFAADLGLGPAGAAASNHEPTEDLSLEDYFQHFVLEHQDHMTETELARKLGISRKCLWERRQRLGIPRRKSGASADS